LNEAIPGSIRRAEHFVNYMRIMLDYLGKRLGTINVETESPTSFLYKMRNPHNMELDTKALRFCYSRLNSLLRTLEIVRLDDFTPLSLVADFCTLVGTYSDGFVILIEPCDDRTPNIVDPILQLACVDSSKAIKNVFDRFQSVVITSGTLSPLDLYPKLLGFEPKISRSFSMSISRKCICPLIITRGSDQLPITTSFTKRSSLDIVRNYASILEEYAKIGKLVFCLKNINTERTNHPCSSSP
jgi:DNA excision repair protein ERCC-2